MDALGWTVTAYLTNAVLLVPLILVTVAAVVRRADLATRVPTAFLASLTAWVSLLLVEQHQQWWSFELTATSLGGMPMEVSLGWALAWGALPVLAGGPWWAWLVGFAWVDLMAVSLVNGLILGEGWLTGEALLLAVTAVPALAIGRLTLTRRWLWTRVGLQGALFGATFLWLLPHLVLEAQGLGWHDVVDHSFPVRSLLLVGVVAFAVPALVAVVELARAGGTPYPWDPPRRLVTTGPYAYVANPMQLGMTGLLVLLTLASGSELLWVAVGFAVSFSAVLAEWHEHRTLAARWEAYATYRQHVRNWWPRWRPYVPEPTTLWVGQTCELCNATGAALDALHPTGLERRAAETAPRALRRMTWEDAHGTDHGITAFARALEQTTLVWAWVGWWMRLPGVAQVLQLVADAVGLGPRDLARSARTARPRQDPPHDDVRQEAR